jgi:hypothetical protein
MSEGENDRIVVARGKPDKDVFTLVVSEGSKLRR